MSLISFKSWAKENHKKTIFGVHSYSLDFPWTAMITGAYEEELKTLGIHVEFKHFYFDAKKSPFRGGGVHPLVPQIVAELKKKRPSLVFITDDFALQQVGPQLTVEKIPFVFSGINGEVPNSITHSSFKKYTGVFERYYIADSVRLLQKLLKKENLRLLLLLEESETSLFVVKYAEIELNKLNKIHFDTVISNDFSRWKKSVIADEKDYDAFLPLQPFVLRESDGSYLPAPKVVEWLYQNSKKPTSSHWRMASRLWWYIGNFYPSTSSR